MQQAWNRQPSWVVKAAVVAGALVILLPLFSLALTAVVTFLLVFLVLGLLVRFTQFIRSLFTGAHTRPTPPANDGRRNVRVLRVDD